MLVLTLALAACEPPSAETVAPQSTVDGSVVAFPAASPQLQQLVVEEAVASDTVAANIPGRLVWNEDRTVRVYPSFGGRVVRILVQVGDVLKAGQPLAEIASPDFGQAQAEARRAATDLELATKNFARMRELHEGGVAALRELQSAQAEHARAESELNRARDRVRLYGGEGSANQIYLLRTPIAGTVVERNVNPGQEVRPDQLVANLPPLFVVTDPSSLWVQLDAREKDLALLKRGMSIELRNPAVARDGFKGRIDLVSDFIDPQSRTIKVRGSVENVERRLKGEMFTTATILGAAPGGVAVNARAVFLYADTHYAFVDRGEGRYERVKVDVGDDSAGRIAVLSGVKVGERVVTEGALLLQQIVQSRAVR